MKFERLPLEIPGGYIAQFHDDGHFTLDGLRIEPNDTITIKNPNGKLIKIDNFVGTINFDGHTKDGKREGIGWAGRDGDTSWFRI